ncbi:hypothetical protein [Mycobacterium sp. OAE908]|uniref:hypothetical protein n=1 Tax=Mycobacterium sp. OAE908 TaxID=2817899 RepID=UPI001AE8646C
MSDGWVLLEGGDIAGLIRHLRLNAGSMELAEVARLMEGAAALSGFDDMREAAAALAHEQGPQQLYRFGYTCIERGIPFLAIPPLRRALEIMPGEPLLLMELVSALERENRHAEAVTVLAPHVDSLDPWPARYLLAYNALLAGDLGQAEAEAQRLPVPDGDWMPARDRLARMIARAHAARAVTPLDGRDLRGWHFALNGGLLITISPYGFNDGMNGRFAYFSDTFAMCRLSLDRLGLILTAAGRRPASVGLLPDRSSQILGLAAAGLFGLPAEPFVPGRPDALVVAYDLNETDTGGLRERADGQVLFEHASCWTDPPAVGGDVTGFLHQIATSPWGERLSASPAGEPQTLPPDERGIEELAAEIVRAAPESLDRAEDGVPGDPDEALVGLAQAVRSHWLTGPRDAARSPGPVPSSRFA